MATVAGPTLVGSMLANPGARACGLCGEFREPTKAHVPPRAAGNTTAVERAADMIDENRVRRPGRWALGGMWVRGLCFDCNNMAGRVSDLAYADFASQVARLSTPTAQAVQVIPGEPPGALFAPGLVARSVLFGMFAINPRLRGIFPELAHDLAGGADVVRWPGQTTLRVGRTHPRAGNAGLLSAGIWMMKVLGERGVHPSFADVVFPPLAWALVPDGTPPELGPQITGSLADASGWIRYSPERVAVDLRHLTRTFPAILHPMLGDDRGSWVEMLAGAEGTRNDTVVVFGRIP